MSLEEIARLNADRAWSQHDQRAIDRLMAARAPQAGSYAGYDADREQHYATAQGQTQAVTLLTNGGLNVGDAVELHGGFADAMPRPNPQTSADLPNPVEPTPQVAVLVQFFTDPVPYGASGLSWTQVFYLFSDTAAPIEVLQVIDYEFPGIQWLLAIDSTGKVHIDFKLNAVGVPLATLRHFQVQGGVLSEVALSESWRKQYANSISPTPPPIEPGSDPCIYGYGAPISTNGNGLTINISLQEMYYTTKPDREDLGMGFSIGYNIYGYALYRQMIEEAIDLEVSAYPLRTDDSGLCATNPLNDAPTNLATLRFPQLDLSGIPANYFYADEGVRYPCVVEISGVLL